MNVLIHHVVYLLNAVLLFFRVNSCPIMPFRKRFHHQRYWRNDLLMDFLGIDGFGCLHVTILNWTYPLQLLQFWYEGVTICYLVLEILLFPIVVVTVGHQLSFLVVYHDRSVFRGWILSWVGNGLALLLLLTNLCVVGKVVRFGFMWDDWVGSWQPHSGGKVLGSVVFSKELWDVVVMVHSASVWSVASSISVIQRS